MQKVHKFRISLCQSFNMSHTCLHFLCASPVPPVFPFCPAKLVQANKHLQQQGTAEVEKHRLIVKTESVEESVH